MDTAMQQVEKGAELLNRYFGNEDWKAKIDVDRLDIDDIYNCILGQLFDSYWRGLETLDTTAFNMPDREYGRYWPDYYGFNPGFAYWDYDVAWTEYLRGEKWEDIDDLDR